MPFVPNTIVRQNDSNNYNNREWNDFVMWEQNNKYLIEYKISTWTKPNADLNLPMGKRSYSSG